MNVEIVKPFLTSTTEVFRTMLSIELTHGRPAVMDSHTPQYEVSGLIGLSGKCQGMVIVSLGRETAIKAAELMLGERPDSLNAHVVDAVGELANMIAGAAKAKLEPLQLTVSLPSVICGRNHSIGFPSNSTPVVLPFESSIGPVCVEVGLSVVEPATKSVHAEGAAKPALASAAT